MVHYKCASPRTMESHVPQNAQMVRDALEIAAISPGDLMFRW